MSSKSSLRLGFTIVELLVVIVVIAILSAITVVSYNGIVGRAKNTSRISEFRQAQKLLETYKALNGNYPITDDMAGKGFCVGTGYPQGLCRDIVPGAATAYSQTDTTLSDRLQTVGSLPMSHERTSTPHVGTYIVVSNPATDFSLLTFLESDDPNICASLNAIVGWREAGTSVVLCSYKYSMR